MSEETRPLPKLQGSSSLDKLTKWEDMPLSSLMAVLTKWFNCDDFKLEVITRESVATRLWFTMSFMLPEWYGHETKRKRLVSASSLELMRERLIKCLDREQLCKVRLEHKAELSQPA